jgi:DNA-binding GntR family transcriptional regulator
MASRCGVVSASLHDPSFPLFCKRPWLVGASGNAFFIDPIKRVNRVRRLLSYRSMQHRERYKRHCKQHLHILPLLEKERDEEVPEALRELLQHMLDALSRIGNILKP